MRSNDFGTLRALWTVTFPYLINIVVGEMAAKPVRYNLRLVRIHGSINNMKSKWLVF